MRVADRLARREVVWRELDELLEARESRLGRRPRGPDRPQPARGAGLVGDRGAGRREYESAAVEVVRLGELYRAACADLMLAEAHDLPGDTVAYLHNLVARAHNVLYRSRGLKFSRWAGELFREVPRRLRAEPALPLAALFFFGPFLLFAMLAAIGAETTYQVMPESLLRAREESFSVPIGESPQRNDAMMAGFYLRNNASIGLQCYIWGLSLGLGTVYILATNGMIIGTMFGYMTRSPNAPNFYQFVTAHSAFELTAIVFSGAAGLRLGWSLISTGGFTRLVSLQRAAVTTLPTIGATVFLFLLAAFLEGFVSASPLPYAVKAAIALGCAGSLVAYLTLGGRGGESSDGGRRVALRPPANPAEV